MSGTGVLGGTFDPVHRGHLAIARAARDRLGLERVLFVPALQPPHKPGVPLAPAEDRARMVELAIAGEAGFALSRIELDRPGPSYAADTVEGLASSWGRVTFILSVEALAGLPAWRDPERFLRGCRVAVVPRAGSAPLDLAWLAARFPGVDLDVVFLDAPLLPISATEVRARVAARQPIADLVPDAVAAYIADHGLYASAPEATSTTARELPDRRTPRP